MEYHYFFNINQRTTTDCSREEEKGQMYSLRYETHLEGKICPTMGQTCSLCSRKKKPFAQCCRSNSKSGHSVNEIHDPLSSDDRFLC